MSISGAWSDVKDREPEARMNSVSFLNKAADHGGRANRLVAALSWATSSSSDSVRFGWCPAPVDRGISPGARRPDGARRGSRVGVEEGCPARELCREPLRRDTGIASYMNVNSGLLGTPCDPMNEFAAPYRASVSNPATECSTLVHVSQPRNIRRSSNLQPCSIRTHCGVSFAMSSRRPPHRP